MPSAVVILMRSTANRIPSGARFLAGATGTGSGVGLVSSGGGTNATFGCGVGVGVGSGVGRLSWLLSVVVAGLSQAASRMMEAAAIKAIRDFIRLGPREFSFEMGHPAAVQITKHVFQIAASDKNNVMGD